MVRPLPAHHVPSAVVFLKPTDCMLLLRLLYYCCSLVLLSERSEAQMARQAGLDSV